MKLYLAYGMNTNFAQMEKRCPAAKYICNVKLKDHQLVFRGVADVVTATGKTAEFALWMITEECEDALDRLEGFPKLYVKKYITTTLNNRRSRMMMYVMRDQKSREEFPAYDGYHSTLVEGYKECGLPLAQIEDAQKRAMETSNFVSKQRTTPIKQTGISRIAPQLPLAFKSTVPNYQREQGLFANVNRSLRVMEDDYDDYDDSRYNALFEKFIVKKGK